ncbi:MAG: UDP-glucose/GDP-mannose dehydrogenase family protein [Thermoguttaceae bacterium]|nr:UDP-glucose/GDP-mannose dehydrogenase family protein [Thermoguttaceae bacterium]
MQIAVIGSGYVGLVTGTCFAQMGNRVTCVDSDAEKIRRLWHGDVPIYEPGLAAMIRSGSDAGDLSFTTDLAAALRGAEIAFIAVGTPMKEDGSADLQYVLAVAEEIGQKMSGDLIIVDKSTVPVGTADKVRETIRRQLDKRAAAGDSAAAAYRFDVASNPEFLKEGVAIADFMRPDRVVLGVGTPETAQTLTRLYEPFVRRDNALLVMDVRSAEMTKYAANAMLALRISFMNEMSRFCEVVGADIGHVRAGIGSDRRIGTAFLFAGCGYGGSCFPKDVQALIHMMSEHGLSADLLRAVEEVNRIQKELLVKKVIERFGEDLTGRVFALWGLAFKPNTDDMRQAPSLVIVRRLIERGATIRAFDPEAVEQAKIYFNDIPEGKISYVSNKYDALNGASALLLLTEWNVFRSPDFDEIKERLREPVIFDGRNQYVNLDLPGRGFDYCAIGSPMRRGKRD